MIELLAGILIVIPFVLLGRKQKYESWIYSLSLVSLPVIYMLFGVFAAGEYVILKELLYGLPFIAIGLICYFYGFKFSAYIVALFWLFHGGYDLYHNHLFINTGVWSWYPVFCAGIDVTLAIYLFLSATKWPRSNIKLSVKNV